jgi:hypothetical protein
MMSMEKETTQLLLRIPVDLKAELQKHADDQGRKLTQEVNIRLRNSLPARGPTVQGILAREAEAKLATYQAGTTPTVHHINDNGPAAALSDTDRAMLDVFRAMPVEKQLALLSLFK